LISEELRIELEVPGAFGRMAAMTAKQVITQRLREAERFQQHAVEQARALKPIDERALPFGKTVLLFDGVPQAQLAPLGETRTPGLADLFVAIMKGTYA